MIHQDYFSENAPAWAEVIQSPASTENAKLAAIKQMYDGLQKGHILTSFVQKALEESLACAYDKLTLSILHVQNIQARRQNKPFSNKVQTCFEAMLSQSPFEHLSAAGLRYQTANHKVKLSENVTFQLGTMIHNQNLPQAARDEALYAVSNQALLGTQLPEPLIQEVEKCFPDLQPATSTIACSSALQNIASPGQLSEEGKRRVFTALSTASAQGQKLDIYLLALYDILGEKYAFHTGGLSSLIQMLPNSDLDESRLIVQILENQIKFHGVKLTNADMEALSQIAADVNHILESTHKVLEILKLHEAYHPYGLNHKVLENILSSASLSSSANNLAIRILSQKKKNKSHQTDPSIIDYREALKKQAENLKKFNWQLDADTLNRLISLIGLSSPFSHEALEMVEAHVANGGQLTLGFLESIFNNGDLSTTLPFMQQFILQNPSSAHKALDELAHHLTLEILKPEARRAIVSIFRANLSSLTKPMLELLQQEEIATRFSEKSYGFSLLHSLHKDLLTLNQMAKEGQRLSWNALVNLQIVLESNLSDEHIELATNLIANTIENGQMPPKALLEFLLKRQPKNGQGTLSLLEALAFKSTGFRQEIRDLLNVRVNTWSQNPREIEEVGLLIKHLIQEEQQVPSDTLDSLYQAAKKLGVSLPILREIANLMAQKKMALPKGVAQSFSPCTSENLKLYLTMAKGDALPDDLTLKVFSWIELATLQDRQMILEIIDAHQAHAMLTEEQKSTVRTYKLLTDLETTETISSKISAAQELSRDISSHNAALVVQAYKRALLIGHYNLLSICFKGLREASKHTTLMLNNDELSVLVKATEVAKLKKDSTDLLEIIRKQEDPPSQRLFDGTLPQLTTIEPNGHQSHWINGGGSSTLNSTNVGPYLFSSPIAFNKNRPQITTFQIGPASLTLEEPESSMFEYLGLASGISVSDATLKLEPLLIDTAWGDAALKVLSFLVIKGLYEPIELVWTLLLSKLPAFFEHPAAQEKFELLKGKENQTLAFAVNILGEHPLPADYDFEELLLLPLENWPIAALSAHFSSKARGSYESQGFQSVLNNLVSRQSATFTLIELGGLLKSLAHLSQKHVWNLNQISAIL
ncbi:MAG: hypothetical protein J0G29_04625, partial [Alphaproteobacteria bacterium]|nr:hypothetical protein [Alphaproteobacteria bacterium]